MTLPPPNILAVDDTPANLQLLVGMLKERGFKVRPVPSGALALEAAKALQPDLILLDITMPEMDGYEVCTRLKQDENLRDIPVLFISALNDTVDKVKAFRAGGLDFITKPFQIDEVAARVLTHLELRRQRRQLQESYRKLAEAEQLRDSLVHMVVHDMKSPLTALRMFLGLIHLSIKKVEPELLEVCRSAQAGVDSLTAMADQMLELSRLEAGALVPDVRSVDFTALSALVVDSLRPLAGSKRLRLLASPAEWIKCDEDLARRILQNLLSNALKFSPEEGLVLVRLRRENQGLRIEVEDQGPGIPPEEHLRIFEKFAQVEGSKRRYGTGLGLTFCKLAVQAHQGAIGVESQPGKGSRFWFTLPA